MGLLDKSGALIPWAVNCAVSYVKDNISKVNDEPHSLENMLKEAKSAHKNISGEAKDIGTQVHELISQYIKNGTDCRGDYPDAVQNAFLSFLEWESNHDITWVKSEMTCLSKEFGFAGTIDAIAKC